MTDHAKYLNSTELAAEIAMIKRDVAERKISDDEKERDNYFADRANAAAIAEQQARIDLVTALYEARRAAGLTQKQLADILGTKQTYIAQIEKGRKNITFATLEKYARACGKKVAISLL